MNSFAADLTRLFPGLGLDAAKVTVLNLTQQTEADQVRFYDFMIFQVYKSGS